MKCLQIVMIVVFLLMVNIHAAEPAKGVPGRKIPKRGTNARGPGSDLKKVILWGSECKLPAGQGLAFGGQDQRADDGRPRTRVWQEEKWVPIHEELRKNHPLQEGRDAIWALRSELKDIIGRTRNIFFRGKPEKEEGALLEAEVNPALTKLSGQLAGMVKKLSGLKGLGSYEAGQVAFALERIKKAQPAVVSFKGITQVETLGAMRQAQIQLETAAEALDAEPPPRACSKMVYDAKTKLYVIFGGDHFDYLMNDVWVFDPAKKKWAQRHPENAPEPRLGHGAEAPGDGTLHVWAGIIYKARSGYLGSAYQHVGGGEWVYDIAANQWKAPEGDKPFSANMRTYRSGAYGPEFYMSGERPNAAVNEERLKAIPANTWVDMKPPKRYPINRDWGTSVIDTDHDLFLQWSGGHSAHGGTDVAQYHFAVNRWELPFPIELPLGQLYSNSSYPGGFNFNRRPWMTGHTYKGYGYSSELKQLVLAVRTHGWTFGHDPYFYLYDQVVGDWTARHKKPKAMCFVSNMYSIQVCHTAHGLFAWSKASALLLDTKAMAWNPLKVKGKLPKVSVDSSGCVYDAKRDRVLFVRKSYGKKNKFGGQVHALDLKTLDVVALSPANRETALGILLREGVYHAAADVFLWGGGKGSLVAYEPNGNRWVKLKVSGSAPFGHSTGHVYDAKRQLLWVVGSRAQVYCLRLDLKAAGL